MKKTLLHCALLVGVLLLAATQMPAQTRYSATTGDVSLSSAATTLTIQQPAANAKQVTLEAAVVYCSAACSLTQSQNGAAATATAGTVTGLLPFGPPATATVWTGSNVGSGTAAGGIIHLAAGQSLTLDLSLIKLGNTGSGTNYSLAIASVTATVNLTLVWREK